MNDDDDKNLKKRLRDQATVVDRSRKPNRAPRKRGNVQLIEPSGSSLREMSQLDTIPPPEEMLSQAVKHATDESLATRLGLEKILSENKLHYCDFDYLHMIEPLADKDSASLTSVAFAKLNSDDVSIKAAYRVLNGDLSRDNSLPIERVNYRLMNNLIANNWTPHVIAYVGSFGCDKMTLLKKLPSKFAAHLDDTLPDPFRLRAEIQTLRRLDTLTKEQEERLELLQDTLSDSKIFDRRNIDFLITEKAQIKEGTKGNLQEWFSKPQSFEDMMNVLFQLLYTFEVFNRIGFRHNDPHPGNLFIEDHTDNPITYNYDVDGVNFTLNLKWYLKVFDFDRSAFNCDPTKINSAYHDLITQYQQFLKDAGIEGCTNTAVRSNSGLCQDFGQCNGINRKYDTFYAFSGLKYYLSRLLEPKEPKEPDLSTKQKNDIRLVLGFISDTMNGAAKHSRDRRYLVSRDKDGETVGDYEPTDKEMPSPAQLLNHKYFKQFLAKPGPHHHFKLPLAPRPEVPILEPAPQSWWSRWLW